MPRAGTTTLLFATTVGLSIFGFPTGANESPLRGPLWSLVYARQPYLQRTTRCDGEVLPPPPVPALAPPAADDAAPPALCTGTGGAAGGRSSIASGLAAASAAAGGGGDGSPVMVAPTTTGSRLCSSRRRRNIRSKQATAGVKCGACGKRANKTKRVWGSCVKISVSGWAYPSENGVCLDAVYRKKVLPSTVRHGLTSSAGGEEVRGVDST